MQNKIQTITFSGPRGAGSYIVSAGSPAGTIQYNDGAAVIATALDTVNGAGADSVVDTSSTVVTVEYVGSLAGVEGPDITVDTTLLMDGPTVSPRHTIWQFDLGGATTGTFNSGYGGGSQWTLVVGVDEATNQAVFDAQQGAHNFSLTYLDANTWQLEWLFNVDFEGTYGAVAVSADTTDGSGVSVSVTQVGSAGTTGNPVTAVVVTTQHAIGPDNLPTAAAMLLLI